MSKDTPRDHMSAIRTYVPGDDIRTRPADLEARVIQPAAGDALALVVHLANVAVTGIIVIAMLIDGSQAKTAIIAGALYFTTSTVAFTALVTGTFTAVLSAHQRETTERARIAAFAELAHVELAHRYAELPQPDPTPAAAPALRVSPLNGTFVAPYDVSDESAMRLEAVNWLSDLFGEDGTPDPRKVHADGRIRVRVLGSKRGGGSREAGQFLIHQRAIRRVEGGYKINLDRFPNRAALRQLL